MLFAVLIGTKPAEAELTYDFTAMDYLDLGLPSVRSAISYSGTQTLRIIHTQDTPNRLFVAARYSTKDRKFGPMAEASATQSFGPMVANAPSDLFADDPAHLTLLTQPFGAYLDPETMHEIMSLRAPAPFHSGSPHSSSQLDGSLMRGRPGIVAGFPAIVIGFRADGPIRGSLPYNEHMHLVGAVQLLGVAWYRRSDGILLNMRTELRITGRVGDDGRGAPVTVIYRRAIRARGQAEASKKAEPLLNVSPA